MSLNVLQVITRALELHGEIPAGGTPDSALAGDMLLALNTLKRAMFGTLIGPRLSPIALTGTSGQAETGGEYQIPGGARFTLTAPLNPRAGARFGAVDAALAWTAFPLSVHPNGRLIDGGAAAITLSQAGQNSRWWFRGDTGAWTAEADWTGLTAAIEFPDSLTAYLPHMLAVATAADFGADVRPEIAYAAGEGRTAFARAYGRRGLAGLDRVIGLAPMAAPQAQER